jgi:hypothetical protein
MNKSRLKKCNALVLVLFSASLFIRTGLPDVKSRKREKKKREGNIGGKITLIQSYFVFPPGVSSFSDKSSAEGKTPVACEASLCLATLLWFDG